MTWPVLTPEFMAASALWIGVLAVSLAVLIRGYRKVGPNVPVPTNLSSNPRLTPRRAAEGNAVVMTVIMGLAGLWVIYERVYVVVALWSAALLIGQPLFVRWMHRRLRAEGRLRD